MVTYIRTVLSLTETFVLQSDSEEIAMNKFDNGHLTAIQAALASKGRMSMAKRSSVFQNAIAVGIPDQKGCMLVSFVEETNEPGRPGWLVSYFYDSDPKEVADGKAMMEEAQDHTVHFWTDLVDYIIFRTL
jgi:hypothetical protein